MIMTARFNTMLMISGTDHNQIVVHPVLLNISNFPNCIYLYNII